LRDLWHLRGQVSAAALVVACGMAAFVSMRSTYESLLTAPAEYYIAYRFADVFAQVKRAPEKSERVVAAGAALITVGDPNRIEIVVDLLSTDAVKVKTGMPVLLEGWGGDRPLRARVRVVEPYGFTKVSALGVEEQRVNVIADFVDATESLGDGYRVDAKIVIWSSDKVLKVLVSALFRQGEEWAVFVVEAARAKRRNIQLGRRGSLEAEVTQGLTAGETVIRHPSNDLTDGARVKVN
jgi:HlyD family secretion protein